MQTRTTLCLPLDAGGLYSRTELGDHFNANWARPRLLLLLSPTCELCVAGARGVALLLRGALADADLQAYAVWLPVLAHDDRAAAKRAAGVFGVDPRVAHYWDQGLRLSAEYRRSLGLLRCRQTIAWDLYLLFPPGAVWEDRPPEPGYWMHQLAMRGAPPLHIPTLRGRLEASLALARRTAAGRAAGAYPAQAARPPGGTGAPEDALHV